MSKKGENNSISLPNGSEILYNISSNECWEILNKKVQNDGTIPCSYKFKDINYNSLTRLVYDIIRDETTDKKYSIKRLCKNKKCINPEHMHKVKIGDWRSKYIGKRYGMLEVIEYIGDTKEVNKKVTCRCDCGNVKNMDINNIKSGANKYTVSCGCIRTEKIAKLNKSHNKSKTRLYKILSGAKHRCYGVNNPKYKNYGARGIKICEEWLNDFTAFYEWAISNGYDDNLTLDRIDVNGNYEPDNCRWIELSRQSSNRQNTIWVNYQGSEVCLRELMVKLDKLSKYESVKNFLFKDGFSIEEALSINDKTDRFIMKMKYLLIENNITNCIINIKQFSTLTGKSVKTLRKRYLNTDRFKDMLKILNVEVLND